MGETIFGESYKRKLFKRRSLLDIPPIYPEQESKRPRKKIPKGVKNSVWAKYIGANRAEGKCYVCKRTIHITDFDIGHNKAVSKGGSDKITNLRPICRDCNNSMGTTSIETYKKRYFSKSKPKTKKKTSHRKKTKAKKVVSPFDIQPIEWK